MTITLRYLQTLTEIASEKNSTIIFPLPIELLNLLKPPAAGSASSQESAGTRAPESSWQTNGFHEIQLNEQAADLLCMTAALVLVVAFLSGVLVGRGVRSEKDMWPWRTRRSAAAAPAPGGTPAPAAQAAPPPLGLAPPTPADEDLTYEKRLEGKQRAQGNLRTAEAAPPSAAAVGSLARRTRAGLRAKDTPKEAAKTAAGAAKDGRPAKGVAARPTVPAARRRRSAEPSAWPGAVRRPGTTWKIVAVQGSAARPRGSRSG